MTEWINTFIGQIAEIKNGYAFKSSDFTEFGVPVVKIKNIKPFKFNTNELSYVSKELALEKSKYLLNKGDILISMSGNRADGSPDSWVGKVCQFKLDGKFLLNQRVSVIEPDKKKVVPEFLAYLLSSWEFQTQFISLANSSGGQANISPNIVKSLEIFIPSLPEQKSIAEVLSSLDDKIDLLHQQNKTLEALAETLFRQWFVEEADDSWEEGFLSDFVDIKYGKDHQKLSEGNIPVFGSGGLMRKVNKSLYVNESVLIPRKGTLSNILFVDEPFWTVDTMFYTVMKRENISKFVYQTVKSFDLASMNVGSAVPSMTTEILNSLPIRIPSESILEKFEKQTSIMYLKLKANHKQIIQLKTLRDTLLPKLMSGAVRVN